MWLALWRAMIWTGIALGLAMTIVTLNTLRYPEAYSGYRARYVGGPLHEYLVAHVDPGSPVARAGVRAGDFIRLPGNGWDDRLEFVTSHPGEPRVLLDRRGTATRTVQYVVGERWGTDLQLSLIAAFTAIVLLFGSAIIAARASAERAPRLLAGFFLALNFLIVGNNVPIPWPAVAAVEWISLNSIVVYLGVASLVVFAAIFPRPGGRFRTVLVRITWPLTAALIAYSVAMQIGMVLTSIPATAWNVVLLYSYIAYVVAAAIAFILSERRSQGSDRQRIRWVAASLVLGLSGPVLWSALAFAGSLDPRLDILQATIIAIPLGAGYAILRHRVVDLGFVVNRALVFTIVSAIVVMAMGILEWILEKVVVEQNHVTSVSLEIALALTLGYFLRRIHGRIDAFVDYVFFRSRHRAEEALAAFARDAHFITDMGTLLRRTVDVVSRCVQPVSVGIWLAGSDHDYVAVAGDGEQRVDENDPLIVRLRATLEPVDATELHSALGGRLALPMPNRGSLSGFLLCGPKRNGEDYDPDEVAALVKTVREVGIALDALRTHFLKTELDRALRRGETSDRLRSIVELALAPPSQLETNQPTLAS